MLKKVLVANRGEIAIRICQTLREMEIETVAVYTEADAASLHVRCADRAVRIENYIDSKEIVRAAQENGADAVHPGYGFLSENPSLSSACESAGIIFIGPHTETIRSMGDKLESKRLMQRVGVPVVPGWDRNPPESEFPVLVKAVGGGGGKGMRLVDHPSQLSDAISAASREAGNAFGDDRVFVEKYIRSPRHIEFQILGDTHGDIVHVFERECSIQRRHQKIIEETPSPALTPELRARMGEAAVAAARAAKYVNAGTVEFVLDPGGQFYFLEMNTRLQVEHAITEMTTGLDLVREQILIADGRHLSRTQTELRQTGHSIECRIYAEVPEENFRPDTGVVAVYRPPSGPGIRLDSGVQEGSDVGFQYDPMLAKLIVWAGDRNAAIERMKRALSDFVILGVRNNIEFLHRIISSDEFRTGSFDTQFLGRRPDLQNSPLVDIPPAARIAASQRRTRVLAGGGGSALPDVWAYGAWRNSGGDVRHVASGDRIEIDGKKQRLYVHRKRGEVEVWVGGRTYRLTEGIRREQGSDGSGEIRALMPGRIRRIEVSAGERVVEKQPLVIMESMKMETTLAAPRSGTVAEVKCQVGQTVEVGELLVLVDLEG